jgi:hypothetical protein
MNANNRMPTNRRPALQFRRAGLLGRWIGCQRPFPAAVGDPWRSLRDSSRLAVAAEWE